MNVRDTFFNQIYEYTQQGEDIVIVSADLGAPSLDAFRQDFGNRFISVGIAEQNLISVAAGLSLAGKKVIAYALNPFSVTRAFDQIRNLMESMKIPITLAMLNVGTCSAEAGYSHMPLEALSLIRTLPHIQCVTPSDETTAKAVAEASIFDPFPRLIQFDKECSGQYYEKNEVHLSGKPIAFGTGTDVTVITYGVFAKRLHDMLPIFQAEKINVRVLNCWVLPLDEKSLLENLSDCRAVICIEDSQLAGGLGSLVLEIFNQAQIQIPIKRIGIQNNYSNLLLNRTALFELEQMDNQSLLDEIKKYYFSIKGEHR